MARPPKKQTLERRITRMIARHEYPVNVTQFGMHDFVLISRLQNVFQVKFLHFNPNFSLYDMFMEDRKKMPDYRLYQEYGDYFYPETTLRFEKRTLRYIEYEMTGNTELTPETLTFAEIYHYAVRIYQEYASNGGNLPPGAGEVITYDRGMSPTLK